MNKVWIAIASCSFLIAGVTGCGKKVPDSHLNKGWVAAMEAPVAVTDLKTTAKTSQGNPLRAYEVKLVNPPEAEKGSGERKLAMPGGSSIVLVVGDPAAAVEIPNARHVIVGGKKAQVNLATTSPTVVVIPATNPVSGLRTLGLTVEETKKKLESGKFDVPLADQVLTF